MPWVKSYQHLSKAERKLYPNDMDGVKILYYLFNFAFCRSWITPYLLQTRHCAVWPLSSEWNLSDWLRWTRSMWLYQLVSSDTKWLFESVPRSSLGTGLLFYLVETVETKNLKHEILDIWTFKTIYVTEAKYWNVEFLTSKTTTYNNQSLGKPAKKTVNLALFTISLWKVIVKIGHNLYTLPP